MPALPEVTLPGRPAPATLWLVLATVCTVLAVHGPSVAELVAVWYRSVSYNHCFLVLPVSAWLLWRDRARLVGVPLRPWWFGLAALGGLAFLWLVGTLASINSLRDFAVVATLPILLATVLGLRFARAMLFPLAFLLFAWPFGEILIPVFIDRTADFTVWALRATGVPVFREGNSFVIPSGRWSVVEECSGIRYLMASATAGSVFAHVNMRSARRRWIFVGLSVLVPIVANWLRAYFIVLLGHFSDNELATGVDHLVYGWVFFGAVMTGLFFFGARWADRAGPERAGPAAAEAAPIDRRMIAAAVAATVVVAAGPVWAALVDANERNLPAPEVTLPAAHAPWTQVADAEVPWIPKQPGALRVERRAYIEAGGKAVGLVVAASYEQGNGEKLLTFASAALADYDTVDATLARRETVVPELGAGFALVERRVRTQNREVLAWQWYAVDARPSGRMREAKWHQALARLAGRQPAVAVYTLSTPVDDDTAPARARLHAFLQQQRIAATGPAADRSDPQ